MPDSRIAPKAKADGLVSARGITGLRVFEKGGRKPLGKVRCLVFHPEKRRCAGILVKRPDVAMVIRRDDLFAAWGSFAVGDGCIEIEPGGAMSVTAAKKNLGIDLDQCVIWQGLQVVAESGEPMGVVHDIRLDWESGRVMQLQPRKDMAEKALLGNTLIPRSLIKGFRTGVGQRIVGSELGEINGAIVVSSDALTLGGEGGLAQKAGEVSAVVINEAKKRGDQMKPGLDAASQRAGKAIDQGAFAAGRQFGRVKGMFSDFKNEYDKAVSDERE